MSGFVKNAWAFFLMMLLFGVYTIPIIVAIAIVALLIARYKPEWLNRVKS